MRLGENGMQHIQMKNFELNIKIECRSPMTEDSQ